MKEYKVLEIKANEAEGKMNEMAKQGWEVVCTNIYPGATIFTSSSPMFITFVREV